MTIRVGVAGTNVGHEHLTAYRLAGERFEVGAVADVDPERARAVAAEFDVPVAVTSVDDLVSVPGLDVVDLCTPPALHLDHIAAALAAGHHVICEKPLVGSLAECDEVERLARAAGRVVMPVFQYRYGRGIQKVRHLVDAGVTGPLLFASVETAWYRGPDYYAVPWRGRWATELGGSLVSHAIHNHDLLTHVAGPVASVSATLATRVNPIEVEDTAAVAVELASGALATLSVTLGSRREVSRLRFCFRDLTAESNDNPYLACCEPWELTPAGDEVAARVADALEAFAPGKEWYLGQFLAFADALEAGEPPPVTVADARAALELVTALYDSDRRGVRVALPLAADHSLRSGWAPPSSGAGAAS